MIYLITSPLISFNFDRGVFNKLDIPPPSSTLYGSAIWPEKQEIYNHY